MGISLKRSKDVDRRPEIQSLEFVPKASLRESLEFVPKASLRESLEFGVCAKGIPSGEFGVWSLCQRHPFGRVWSLEFVPKASLRESLEKETKLARMIGGSPNGWVSSRQSNCPLTINY